MQASASQKYPTKRNKIRTGLILIGLISLFKIGSDCVAYRETYVMVGILKQAPPGFPPVEEMKKKEEIADMRETIWSAFVIEVIVFLTAVGCIWELRRLGDM